MEDRGVFKCLENLENHHDTYTNNLGFHEPAENGKLTTCTYAQRISQLKSRRDELQRKLSVLKQMEEEAEGEEPEEEVGGARLAAAEEMLLREKLKLSCYQFVGISSIALDSNSDGNKITLRFETSHRNIVKESYFMELAQSDTGLTVCRHDLPCFVPLVDLEKEHLMTNTQLFLMHVSDYLQAYVKRREEANLVKEILGEISCDLSLTLPADYIEIKIGGAEWSFALEVQMTYANILKMIPTQVVMSLEFEEEEPEADQMRKWREHFKSQPLSVAMETVWLELRKFISAK